MDSFIFGRPTGKAPNEKTAVRAASEMERAIREWRREFRGEVQVKDDLAMTEEDIRSANLVLWGDPASNSLIAKIAPQPPLRLSAGEIKAGEHSFPTLDHAPPDWAVIDLNTAPNSRYPGAIPTAGFFREKWEWKAGF